MVGRSPDACRQIASRARRRVREERAQRRPADQQLLTDLVGALAAGEVDRVIRLMSPEVVLTSDGGPARRAARRPVIGPERVARLLVNLAARAPQDGELSIEELNGAPAFVLRAPSLGMVLTAECTTDPRRIGAVRLVLNPDKLGGLDRSTPLR
jgi:RNA polymerase sigma-70 factor, ECF subfamily